MKLEKMTTLLVVDAIEPLLPTWEKLGFATAVKVPEKGKLDFVILASNELELMLQTRASLTEDLPDVAKLSPAHLLYADVKSLDEAERTLKGARVIVSKRRTPYGAFETWVELAGGTVLGLSQLPD
jgi:hypothetical protein